jgi:hypothetical protein
VYWFRLAIVYGGTMANPRAPSFPQDCAPAKIGEHFVRNAVRIAPTVSTGGSACGGGL